MFNLRSFISASVITIFTWIICHLLPLQVFSHLLSSPLQRDEDTKERRPLHLPGLGLGFGFLWTVSQLLHTDGPCRCSCLYSCLGDKTAHHNGYLHLHLWVPHPRPGAWPHVRSHSPIPMDQRGPHKGHV